MTLTPTSLRTTITNGLTGLLADFATAWNAINQLTNGGIEQTDVNGLATALSDRALFANSVKFAYKDPTTGFWPSGYDSNNNPIYTGGSTSTGVRPSSSDRCMVFWIGAAPNPAWVSSGTGGAHTPDIWIQK